MKKLAAPSANYPIHHSPGEAATDVCGDCWIIVHQDETNCPVCGASRERDGNGETTDLKVFMTDVNKQNAMRIFLFTLPLFGGQVLAAVVLGLLTRSSSGTENSLIIYGFSFLLLTTALTGGLIWETYKFINSGRARFPVTLFLPADIRKRRFYPPSYAETLAAIEKDSAANEKLLTEIAKMRGSAANPANRESLQTALQAVSRQQAVLNLNCALVKAQILARRFETFVRRDYDILGIEEAAARSAQFAIEIGEIKTTVTESNHHLELDGDVRETIFTQLADLSENVRRMSEIIETRATAAILSRVKETSNSCSTLLGSEDLSDLPVEIISRSVEEYEFIRCLVEDERDFEKMRIEAGELLKISDVA